MGSTFSEIIATLSRPEAQPRAQSTASPPPPATRAGAHPLMHLLQAADRGCRPLQVVSIPFGGLGGLLGCKHFTPIRFVSTSRTRYHFQGFEAGLNVRQARGSVSERACSHKRIGQRRGENAGMAIKTTRGKMSSVIHITHGAQMLEMCTKSGGYLTS